MTQQHLSAEAMAAVERAMKLLALARNNPNQHEAESAAAKAMEIIAQHNLDMSVIERRAGQGSAKRQDTSKGGGLYKWQRDLWGSVAVLNFCVYRSIQGLSRGDKYEHRLIGRPENVISTQVMAEYLQGAIDRLAKVYASDTGTHMFSKDAIAYREGMAATICDRLNTLREQRLAEDARKAREEKAREEKARSSHPSAPPGTALTLVDVKQSEDDANEDYIRGWEPGTSAQRRLAAEQRQREYEAEWLRDNKIREFWSENGSEGMIDFLAELFEGMTAPDLETAIRQQQRKDKREAEYEAYLRGEDTETYGKGRKDPTPLTAEQYYARYSRARPKPREAVYRYSKSDQPRAASYYDGLRKGRDIGLDAQIEGEEQNKLEAK